MAQDISIFGLEIRVTASVTYPNGISLSAFADDADPFDIPELTLAEHAMGANGDLISFRSAQPIPITINLIPKSEDDRNMAALFEANRVGRGKQAVQDVLTVTGVYPDGTSIVLSEGTVTSFMPGDSAASSGRLKSKPYTMNFENIQPRN